MRLTVIIPFLLWCYSGFAVQDTIRKLRYPSGYTEQLNVVYSELNGWKGEMDIYLPPVGTQKASLIIIIHGGGWNHGTRQGAVGGLSLFLSKGYAIANVSYRLVNTAPAPAAIEDVRCALLYLVANADKLNVDISKIVLVGNSAGGHLALMCGLLGNNHLFDKHCSSPGNVKVAAIIDRYGITDVWDWAHGPHKTSSSALKWLGEKRNDQAFANSVSPITYVNKTSPPVFIIHGNADPVVPIEHSEALYKKLKDNGVKAEFEIVEGGLHGQFSKEKGGELNKKIMKFLKKLELHN